MSKKKKRQKQLGRVPGLSLLEELFTWFAAGRIHAVVRTVDGEEHLILGRFDNRPLPPYLTRVAIQNKPEIADLVRRNDVKVCIAPTDPTHSESIREDEQGRRYCHACVTYRDVSEKMRTGQLEAPPEEYSRAFASLLADKSDQSH